MGREIIEEFMKKGNNNERGKKIEVGIDGVDSIEIG